MNRVFYIFLVFFSIISFIGGVNWLVTAINSWINSSEPNCSDLLQDQMNIDTDVANVIYCVVFLCSLALLCMIINPNVVKKNMC